MSLDIIEEGNAVRVGLGAGEGRELVGSIGLGTIVFLSSIIGDKRLVPHRQLYRPIPNPIWCKSVTCAND